MDFQWISEFKDLPILIQSLAELFRSEGGWIVLLPMLGWFIKYSSIDIIYDLYEKISSSKIKQIENYISNSSNANPKVLSTILDERDSYYFKLATKIDVRKDFREALIELHERTSHNLLWSDIKRAFPFIIYENSKITIKELGFWSKFYHIYNRAIGIALAILSGLLYIYSITSYFFTTTKFLDCFLLFIESTILFGMALVALMQNWPYRSRKIISDEINKLDNAREKV